MKFTYIFMALILAGMVNAFEIVSPESTIYNSDIILFSVEHNETLESISYVLDNSSETIMCTNCSSYEAELNLTEGEHTLKVFGVVENVTKNVSVEFTVDTVPGFTLELNNPKNKIYNINILPLDIESSMTLESISYVLDNSSKVIVCTNCSKYNTTLNLTEGEHTITAYGKLENVTKNDSATFNIELAQAFSVDVKSPQSRTYYYKDVRVLVESNITLDVLRVELGNLNWTCTNCSRINQSITLDYGNYTLKAKGFLDEWSKTVFVDFKIQEKEAPKNYSGNTTFDMGFEKLPKMVAAGELTDAELADIIRNNKLNPGVLNRLIKTGKLGNESINAILDTQFQPQGIFWKLVGKIGLKQKTYTARIAENYNLTEDTKEKIIMKEDLPKKTKARMVEEINSNDSKESPGQAKKASEDKVPPGQAKNGKDSEDKVSPGQAKKASENNSAKIPPGQAKKLM
ncbi:MAG: hypothetical protein ACP5OA_04515 [Candidatus Woesearchaeota archaeon]